jgi:drug/metabolite transporter (DMT)-like permease
MLVLGVFNSVVPNALIAVAMQDLATAPAAMIQATIPVLVVLFGLVVAVGERPRAIQLLGIGIGLCGAGIVIGPDAILGGSKTLLGSAAMFGTACSYAFTTLYLRRAKPRDMGSAALGQQFIAAPLAQLPADGSAGREAVDEAPGPAAERQAADHRRVGLCPAQPDRR